MNACLPLAYEEKTALTMTEATLAGANLVTRDVLDFAEVNNMYIMYNCI